MTDVAELIDEQILITDSNPDLSSPPLESPTRLTRTRRRRKLALDDKSTDRLMRMMLAFPPKARPQGTTSAENGQENQQANQNSAEKAGEIDDLVHVHVLGSATFDTGGPKDSNEVLKQIFQYPALELLDQAAKMVATMYIFQARMAYRLKADAKYWVLGGLGAVYPYPLAVRTGAFPTWKSQIRRLEKLRKYLSKSASEALRVEADTLASNRPHQMPTELIWDAEIAIERAINWMRAFPSPTKLRSEYRRIVRPRLEESVGAVAYVLDRLFREHTRDSALKVKDIENRVAGIEAEFLGQNIQCSPEFGCPAVRLQVRTVKRSKVRSDIDRRLRASLKTINGELRKTDRSTALAAARCILRKLVQHRRAYDAWQEGTEQALKEELRRALQSATHEYEADRLVDEYKRKMRNHLDLAIRWIKEYRERLEAWDSPDVEFWSYDNVTRQWMKRWESLWSFPM